jgi:hypothetical protein
VAILRCALLDDRFDLFWNRRNKTDHLNIRLVA